LRILKVNSKDFLSVEDFSGREINHIFAFTSALKAEIKKGKKHNYLHRKSLAMIFEKDSTRTRVSFETGMTQLGGHALFISGEEIKLGKRETVHDIAKVLSRYVDGIMIRTFSHANVVEMAAYAAVPVINGLSDSFHPCQALADIFTIYEREKGLRGVKLSYIGDGNNVANSLLHCAALTGVDISIACPDGYRPDEGAVEFSKKAAMKTGSKIEITDRIEEAVRGSNYIYTDVWTSMGQERESAKRKKIFAKYKISKKLLSACAPDCRVMHCLPAHRGEEIDADVLDSERSIVFDQAENRLHVQKAIMCALMTK